MTTDYLRGIKKALTGDGSTPLVLVCNFEAEAFWAERYLGLPSVPFSASTRLVRRMEELGVLLGGPDDYLVVSEDVDPGFRRYAEDLGFALPTVLVPENVDPARSTTENALASPELLARLGGIDGVLLPMGTTVPEQKLAEETGLPLAVPGAEVFERVNSKIYGRRVAAAGGLRPVPGFECETTAEFLAVLDELEPLVAQGERVVVKDAYGVSGKGLVVLDAAVKVAGVRKLVTRRAARTGDDRLHVVVERWLPKRFDLNYQFTVGRDGAVAFDFVKQALTEDGVHKGHLVPAELPPHHHEELRRAADVIGARLHADGFSGVAGVDAILGADGVLYPLLEINARLNMSTYQGGVTERLLPPGHTALARHYTLRLDGRLPFDHVRATLGALLDERDGERVVVTCAGTVNANAADDAPFEGRLYAVLVAPDRSRLAALDAATQTALTTLESR
ncbi:ATP-grasp domain-containing protein [Umezawaea tangerina]|uniref:ATP-grasp domain-containing protein n=1 Tax=Umezawaea tangerina TaxID=84725 RepID=A0A2T0SXH7_9PSEU|nr:ATP-grasp domain-containing protein [Umezawaea tangerina]PRY38126.1 ATP-grasp domain-containing protein [Umezawaea tangerina]